MKLDILAFGAHPDDVELSCSGTILKHIHLGKKVGIVDLTRGELGTRGTPEIRFEEAKSAAKILGVVVRDNLNLEDGFFRNDKESQLKVIKKIRQYQPEIVLTNAIHDRHPDHGRASQIVTEACFLAGLLKIETEMDGKLQLAWRPKAVYNYIQYWNTTPSFVIDISDFIEKKMEAVRAFGSQFYNPASVEPSTLISQPEFLDGIMRRAEDMGKIIGVKYGEGFTADDYTGVKNVSVIS